MSSVINWIYIYIVRLKSKKVRNSSWNTRNFSEILLNLDHAGVRVFNVLWETPSSYWIALTFLPDTLYISSHQIRGCAKIYSKKNFPHVKIGHPIGDTKSLYFISFIIFKKKKKKLCPFRESNLVPQRYLNPCCAPLRIRPLSFLASVEL